MRTAKNMKRNGEVVIELADRIRANILDGAFKPGASLREATIIEQFGCSRTSAREALRLLIQSGLTVKTPNQSYRISQFDERDVHELTTLRLQLEQLGGRIAFGREDLVQGLSLALDELRDAVSRGNKVDAFKAHRHFHEAIIEAAGHRRLTQAYATMGDQIEFAFLSLGRLRRNIDRLVAEHEQLFDVAKNGTMEEFLAELAVHIQGGLGVPAAVIEPMPFLRRAPATDSRPPVITRDKLTDREAEPTVRSRGYLGW